MWKVSTRFCTALGAPVCRCSEVLHTSVERGEGHQKGCSARAQNRLGLAQTLQKREVQFNMSASAALLDVAGVFFEIELHPFHASISISLTLSYTHNFMRIHA